MTEFSWKCVMKYRNIIYGMAAVWIVFFHIHDMIRIPKGTVLADFLHFGNISVDIFLFFSAVGLTYSIEKNSLRDFYKNRILRLIIPFAVICIPYYMWRDSVTGITPERIRCFFLDITAANFWLKEKVPFWYVSLAIVLYLIFPLLYKLYRKNKFYLAILIFISIAAEILLINNGILVHAEKALSRFPIFMVGIFLSDYIKENRSIKVWHNIILLLIFTVSFYVYRILDTGGYFIMYKRFTFLVMTVPMIALTALCVEKIKNFGFYEKFCKVFDFFGGISLELYLVHNAITRILKYYNLRNYPPFTYYLWIFPVSVALAVLYSKIGAAIVEKIENQPVWRGKYES